MKPDILVVCILSTWIFGGARHVFGFLTAAQQNAAFQQQPAPPLAPHSFRSALYAGARYLNGDNKGIDAAAHHIVSSSQERAIYDPGDDLLHVLNEESAALDPELPEDADYADTVYNELEVVNKQDMLKKIEEDIREEQELVEKSALLMKMLEDPTIETLPIVYVDNEFEPIATDEDYNKITANYGQPLANGMAKRSRYSRRYPWKRHNRNRGSYMTSINSNYEPELRYACTPSKEDIFKLLVNLHENRKGKHSKTVNFCNRKRPAKAVFTNIRFLG